MPEVLDRARWLAFVDGGGGVCAGGVVALGGIVARASVPISARGGGGAGNGGGGTKDLGPSLRTGTGGMGLGGEP